MQFNSSAGSRTRWLKGSLLLLVCTAEAYGADSYSAGQLTMPTLVIGNATYSNVVVKVASIVSGPAGSAPIGTVDTYNPANGQLTVQTVSVGGNSVYNVVATVASLVSIGGVSGADTYSGGQLNAPIVLSNGAISSNVTYRATGAVSVAGGMPAALYDSLTGTTLTIPAVAYAGRVFTNVTAPVTQTGVGGTNQTITFTKPVPSFTALPVGSSEAISATASSGLPVSYVVDTPTICTVVQNSAQEGYAYFSYSATGGSGNFVLGAAPLGGGVYQGNFITGTSNGQPLGIAAASTALNLYPSSGPYNTPPYDNFVTGEFIYDNVLFATGGPLMDRAGIALTTPGDAVINLLYGPNRKQYLYADSTIIAAGGPYQVLTISASLVNGLVGLANGACMVTAFQPGNGAFSAAAPVTITVDVGVIILP